MDPRQIYGTDLPADAIMPLVRRAEDHHVEPTLHVPPSPLHHHDEERQRALQGWIHSHQLFFLSLNVATYAARQVTEAARWADLDAVEKWMDRVIALRLDMVALTFAAGNMSRATYEGCIRREMSNVYPEFSGLSNLDNWRFDDSVQEMKRSLASPLNTLQGGRPDATRALLEHYDAANRVWWEYHGNLMHRLLTVPVSLARGGTSQAQLDRAPSYKELKSKHRNPVAIAIFDQFFGCTRRQVSLDRFQQLVKLAVERVRPHQDRAPELLTYFARGEVVRNDILQEALGADRSAGGGTHPAWQAGGVELAPRRAGCPPHPAQGDAPPSVGRSGL